MNNKSFEVSVGVLRATMIRLVLFDALFTLVTPRKPISTQYAEAFKPFFGALDERRVKSEFKQGLSD